MNLFDLADRQMVDTSLDAFASIRLDLWPRDVEVFTALHRYIASTGYPDATGGELAAWSGIPILRLRPRYTSLHAKGWVERRPARASRQANELRAHPYRPVLPLSALDRLKTPG